MRNRISVLKLSLIHIFTQKTLKKIENATTRFSKKEHNNYYNKVELIYLKLNTHTHTHTHTHS